MINLRYADIFKEGDKDKKGKKQENEGCLLIKFWVVN